MKETISKARHFPYTKGIKREDMDIQSVEWVDISRVHWNKSIERRVDVYFKTLLKRIVANGYDH